VLAKALEQQAACYIVFKCWRVPQNKHAPLHASCTTPYGVLSPAHASRTFAACVQLATPTVVRSRECREGNQQ